MTIWLSLLLVFVTAGCAVRIHHDFNDYQSSVTSTPSPDLPNECKMVLRYQIRDGCAALEVERFVLLFHGLTPAQQRIFRFQGGQQVVQVSGNGTSSTSVTCATGRGTVAFHSDYAEGTNTLQFGQQAVQFTQGGRLLSAGGETVDLAEGRKVVHLKSNKVLSVE